MIDGRTIAPVLVAVARLTASNGVGTLLVITGVAFLLSEQ